ncbi:glycosyltransferase [Methylotetracoccus oryzae]|uniref:glycosyltransferase n=1 Tax=Methylotetracoccus oryzae TaxID=1919059 RepID=UPI001F30274E|nr:glycosyltransferase [Methylotetracoccus oryzae]
MNAAESLMHKPEGPTVAYLVSQYPSFSHTFILREIAMLRRQGFIIRVASVNPPDRPLDKLTNIERAEAQATHYLKQQSAKSIATALIWAFRTHPAGTLQSLLFAWKLARWDWYRLVFNHFYWLEALLVGHWMHEQDCRHLHVHFATPAATVGLLARKAFPIRFSMTVHGPDEFYDVPGYALREKVAGADFILCISHFARSQLMKLSLPSDWDKLHVCRLGVDPTEFRPVAKNEPDQPFTIVSVGRLSEAKGPVILLRAIHRLKQDGRSLRLILVGGGPLENLLKDWVARHHLTDTVRLTGPVDQDHIRDHYASADCFALASFAEGIPVVLMEAMAMAIPCVTTHITGIPELIQNEQDGLLVAPGDDVGLAAAIGLLMDDPALRERLGRAGRQRILREYDLERNVGTLGETLRRLLRLSLTPPGA